jgi:hypothetical protein
VVNPELPGLLKEYSKVRLSSPDAPPPLLARRANDPPLPAHLLPHNTQAVIRANPKDIYAFSAEFFRLKAGIPGDPIPGSDA